MGKSALQQNAEQLGEQHRSQDKGPETEREFPKAAPPPSGGYDNTNNGAVYPTAIKGELDGPMDYFGQAGRATFKRIEKDGKITYLLTVKVGATVVAKGLMDKSGNEDSLKADLQNKPPRFRGVLKDANDSTKTLPVAMWFAHQEARASDYYQIRPDTQFVAADLKDF